LPKKKTAAKKSAAADAFMQAHMFGAGKHRVAAANFNSAKKKAPAAVFNKTR